MQQWNDLHQCRLFWKKINFFLGVRVLVVSPKPENLEEVSGHVVLDGQHAWKSHFLVIPRTL
jgi:hypothetical protein